MVTVAHKVCPLPDLGTINTDSEHEHHDCPVNKAPFDETFHLSSDSAVAPETPTSSDFSTERSDPITLTRPVEGFHHPRRHMFTDRLVGRFFEDSSLNAETRKTNKCLAGLSGTAESVGHRRPSTALVASTTLPDMGSRSRHLKRMQHRASIRALGGVRQATGVMKTGISARMEQVENEIIEQKSLIEELEGRMASLSSRGGRAKRRQEIEARAAQESTAAPSLAQYDFGNRKQDADGHPTMTPGTAHLVDAIDIMDGSEVLAARSCHINKALSIQESILEDGNRKLLLSLGSARQKFESQLQTLLQKTGTLARELRSRPATDAVTVEIVRVAAAAELVLEASRVGDFVEPPVDNLRSLFSGMERVRRTLASLATAVRENKENGDICQTYWAVELCFSVAEGTLEAIREALDADVGVNEPALSDRLNPSPAKDRPLFPAGSGRAAAVASAGHTREGLLVSPDVSNRQEAVGEVLERTVKGGGSNSSYKAQRGGRDQTRRVKLSALGVEEIEELLRTNGFGEYAPRFVSQAVDGVMLSDSNLCEVDFLELGLGGKCPEGDDSRSKIVAFFRRCQNEGVIPGWGALPLSERVAGSRPGQSSGKHSTSKSKGENGMSMGLRRENLTGARRIVEQVEERTNLVEASEAGISRAEPTLSFRLATPIYRKQDMTVNIPIEANVRGTAPAAPRGSNIPPVKLNYGVIVTINGNEVGRVQSVDGYSDNERDNDDSDEKEEGVVPPTEGHTTSYVVQDSSQTSLVLPAVSLEYERCRRGDREICEMVDDQLPPGVAVKISDVTLDVFTS